MYMSSYHLCCFDYLVERVERINAGLCSAREVATDEVKAENYLSYAKSSQELLVQIARCKLKMFKKLVLNYHF